MQELTDISTVRMLCEKHGFSLSKNFGQNFLVNPGICPKICDTAMVNSASEVLEIGPGFGTLTQQLARRAKKVVAVEVDTRLLPVLAETLDGLPVTVVNQDILECDIPALLQAEFQGPAKVCANLPYYITSPILMRLLEGRYNITDITVMVQKEAAQRITAAPGTREAGAISYAVHYYCRPQLAFTVKPGSFYPPPKVTSAVINLQLHPHTLLGHAPERERRLFKLIRAAFGQRRKTLVNAASAGLAIPKQQLADAMQATGLDVRLRPEQCTLENYIQLEACLWPAAN